MKPLVKRWPVGAIQLAPVCVSDSDAAKLEAVVRAAMKMRSIVSAVHDCSCGECNVVRAFDAALAKLEKP